MSLQSQPKAPPFNIEAEQSVLGGIMLDNKTFHAASAVVTEHDFYREDHKVIWAQIEKGIRSGRPVDFITLSNALKDAGQLADAGGMAYIGQIANDTPSAANVRAYAEIVRELAQRRNIIACAHDIIAEAYTAPADEISMLLQQRMAVVLSRTGAQSVKYVDVIERAERAARAAQERRKSGSIQGFTFGLSAITKLMGYITGPRLIILAARPKCGKSALLNMGALVSGQAAQPGLVVSIELCNEELGIRSMAYAARVSVSKIHRGYEEESEQGLTAAVGLGDLPVWFDDTSSSLDAVCAQIASHRHKYGIAWAAVDHIGLLSTRQKFNSQNDKMGHISWTLKQLAKSLGIPIVALAQLSRKCDSDNRRPRPDDLRDSGNIEQDADAIVMMHTPLAQRDKLVKPLEIGIPANRMGPGIWCPAKFEFDGRTQRIYEVIDDPGANDDKPARAQKKSGSGLLDALEEAKPK